MPSAARPTIDECGGGSPQIPDPEIPLISLVDLGIVRDVDWDGDTLVVGVTPTYSGCPATSIINLDIERSLCALGVETLRLERRLAPPWTTDWISAGGAREACGRTASRRRSRAGPGTRA